MRLKVKVLLFSVLRDYVGGSKEIEVNLDDDFTVSGLIAAITKKYVKLGKYVSKNYREGGHILILINGRPAKFNDQIKEGDEIAIIPTPSGG